MKSIQKLTAILLTLMLLLTIAAPAAVAASNEIILIGFEDLSGGQRNPNPVPGASMSIDWDGVTQRLLEGFRERRKQIDLSEFNIAYVDKTTPDYLYFKNVLVENPRLHKFFNSYSC